MDDATPTAAAPSSPPPARFSLERLSAAFARLMGAAPAGAAARRPAIAVDGDDALPDIDDDSLPVTPRMIVEGLLFVGMADGRPLASRELAAHMRNVQADEVDAIVAELNDGYRRDDAAYEIVLDGVGYRLQLRAELAAVRLRLRGRARTAKLTPAALEVLAIVAYRQPVTADDVNRLRGTRCQAVLAQLVQRQLLSIERLEGARVAPRYATTERFNQAFGVASAAALPRSEDLDDS